MSFSLQGLASGLDTAEIIKGLMDVERVPYKNLETKKSQLQNQQAVFRQLNTKLNAMQLAASEMRYESAYNKNTSKLSNSGIVTATAGDSAIKGSYDIQVNSLAKNGFVTFGQQVATVDGEEVVQTGKGISGAATSLENAVFKFGDPTNQRVINVSDLGDYKDNKTALEAIAAKINSNSTAYGGRANVINVNGKDGEDAEFVLSVTSLNGKDPVQLSVENAGTLNDSVRSTPGQDAELVVNGITITRPTNEVKGAIEGVTLNLTSTGDTTLNVTKDTAAITASAEKFVNAYNDLMKSINLNLAKPADEDSTNPLQGDTVLKSLKDTLYGLFTDIIPASVIKDGSGRPGAMEQLGLSIDKNITTSSQRTGEITFDKAAFATALDENIDRVMNMFIDRTDAIWNAMSTSYAGATRGIIASKISGYDSQIKMVDERLEVMDRSLLLKEERLNKQFNNMEVMLSSLYNEQSWLASQFNSLMSSGN